MTKSGLKLKWFMPGQLGVLAVLTFAYSCANNDIRDDAPSGKVTAAIGESDQSPSFSVSVPLPPNVDIQNVSIASSTSIRLPDRIKVAKATVSTTYASSGIQVEVGTDTKIGPITSYGNVELRDRASITGDITAAGTVRTGNFVTVTGNVNQSAALAPATSIQWNAKVDGPNLGPLSLEPDTTKDIATGRYANGAVKSRSTLTLHSGTYYFDDLMIEPQSKLILDDALGPVLIYIGNSFTYRGSIQSSTGGIPKLLVAIRGSGGAMIEAPFTGALVAPEGNVSLQAARPEPHRAVVIGKHVNIEPDTVLQAYAFDWPAVVGGVVNPDYPDTNPHKIIPSTIDTVLSADSDNIGAPVTSTTGTVGSFVPFTLPDSYTVDGGLIANGTVSVSFDTPQGGTMTCIYQGQSSTATPNTTEELVLGRMLKFISCSDGEPARTQRQGGQFVTTVTPVLGLPVTVSSPVQEVGACHEKLEVISSLETYNLRKNFSWNSAQKVQEMNDSEPALYYAWVYVRNREDQLNLKKLRVHQLTRPIFTDELDALAGKCGVFRNPGDGEGFMVPVLIPGKTYNALIDVQHRDDIEGDKVLFDAVIIRQVPANARNENGSINLNVLKNAHFVYLPYETRPLPSINDVRLDSGASKALMSAISWVGQAAKDVGEFFTNTLGQIDKWLRGSTTVNLQISAITEDPMFGSDHPIMKRAWGDTAGQKLGAPGLQVSILQKFLGTFVPETSMGHTGANGNVSINAVDGGSTRGATGLCIELSNDAAKIVGDSIFFLPEEICDFRAFVTNDPSGATGTPSNFRLQIKSESQSIHIDNTLLAGMYQADDTYRYAQRVVGMSPKQARIITGYWAETISPGLSDGKKNLWAPCLNYPNTISDAALGVGIMARAGAGSIAGPLGAVLGSLPGTYLSLHIGNADIIMPENSRLPIKRAVMSHEMGHYMFCSMLQEQKSNAIVWVILETILNSGLDNPVRYLNEAVADFFTGQVAGGADYMWADKAGFSKFGYSYFCAPQSKLDTPDTTSQCMEANLTATTWPDNEAAGIGRIATLLHDASDDTNSIRGTLRVESGAAWQWTPTHVNGTPSGDYPLVNATQDYIKYDFENVAIGGSGIRDFSHHVADDLALVSPEAEAIIAVLGGLTSGSITAAKVAEISSAVAAAMNDEKIYRALNDTMKAKGYSWCDRCSVLALHEPGAESAPTDWTPELFNACQKSSFLSNALNEAPPEPSLNLNRLSCTACPTGTVRNADYTECEACNGVVVGDKCQSCPPDIIISSADLRTGVEYIFPPSTPQAADDVCPNVLWIEVLDIPGLFASNNLDSLSARMSLYDFNTEGSCTRLHTLYRATQSGSDAFSYSAQRANGEYSDECWTTISGTCFGLCDNLPKSIVLPNELPTNVMFGIPTDEQYALTIVADVGDVPVN